ncbi:DUF357 domain-containing protein [Candidatus Woesearchaeota archaeon]|nr:DUF357 domain-containing protein [Candidatus Woesearchaeota archaeon]
MNLITDIKLKKYFSITEKALKKAKIKIPERTHLHVVAMDFYNMAELYFNDAKHFEQKGNLVNAFAALNYAHGWLDAGARLGLFDVKHDSKLFTVD